MEDAGLAVDADRGRWAAHGYGFGVVEDLATGAFVGRGGLQPARIAGTLAVELGWALLPDRWGQGLATEMALGATAWARGNGLAELVAVTLPDNARSRRVMERAGLREEADVVHAGLSHALYRVVL